MKNIVKVILLIMLLVSTPSFAYETKGDDTHFDYYERQQTIKLVSKDNAKYIYNRILFYQAIKDPYEAMQIHFYIYNIAIPEMLETMEKDNGTNNK